jgi:hypothetical protein
VPLRRLGRIRISYLLLERVLKLPADCRIEKVFAEDLKSWYTKSFVLVLEDPRLKEIPEGQVMPEIELLCSQEGCDIDPGFLMEEKESVESVSSLP